MGSFNSPQEQIDDYDSARYLFWKGLYRNGGITLYARKGFNKKRAHNMNIEHVYPMSWVVNEIGCFDRDACRRYSDRFNQIEADLHNMYPSLEHINRLRGSHSFGNVKSPNKKMKDVHFEMDLRRRIVEPDVMSQGNVARALFYMADAYDLTLFAKQVRVLKVWNKIDPPSLREKRRNDLIELLQGNRNHFIDYPNDVGSI